MAEKHQWRKLPRAALIVFERRVHKKCMDLYSISIVNII